MTHKPNQAGHFACHSIKFIHSFTIHLWHIVWLRETMRSELRTSWVQRVDSSIYGGSCTTMRYAYTQAPARASMLRNHRHYINLRLRYVLSMAKARWNKQFCLRRNDALVRAKVLKQGWQLVCVYCVSLPHFRSSWATATCITPAVATTVWTSDPQTEETLTECLIHRLVELERDRCTSCALC